MKKFLLGLMMILATAVCFAQVPQINYAAEPGVEIVNDSTLIYKSHSVKNTRSLALCMKHCIC